MSTDVVWAELAGGSPFAASDWTPLHDIVTKLARHLAERELRRSAVEDDEPAAA